MFRVSQTREQRLDPARSVPRSEWSAQYAADSHTANAVINTY